MAEKRTPCLPCRPWAEAIAGEDECRRVTPRCVATRTVMTFSDLHIRLPDWVDDVSGEAEAPLASAEERMRFVIGLSRHNSRRGTGGPFGAAVFDRDSGRLISPGVNLVMALNCSTAHAEIVALSLAQQILGCHDLGAQGLPSCELVTSTEPCSMCLGAVCWSGVRSLVCGARDEDARAAGFDEGPKHADWQDELYSRGIAVSRDVLRSDAAAVLREYLQQGGPVYNARTGNGSR